MWYVNVYVLSTKKKFKKAKMEPSRWAFSLMSGNQMFCVFVNQWFLQHVSYIITLSFFRHQLLLVHCIVSLVTIFNAMCVCLLGYQETEIQEGEHWVCRVSFFTYCVHRHVVFLQYVWAIKFTLSSFRRHFIPTSSTSHSITSYGNLSNAMCVCLRVSKKKKSKEMTIDPARWACFSYASCIQSLFWV